MCSWFKRILINWSLPLHCSVVYNFVTLYCYILKMLHVMWRSREHQTFLHNNHIGNYKMNVIRTIVHQWQTTRPSPSLQWLFSCLQHNIHLEFNKWLEFCCCWKIGILTIFPWFTHNLPKFACKWEINFSWQLLTNGQNIRILFELGPVIFALNCNTH